MLFMPKEELEENLQKVKEGDPVVIIRRSSKSTSKNELCDYMEGIIKAITEKTITISFTSLPDKRVLKSTILSLKIK